MKDGKSLVTDGANQYHAIFGNGPAYFVSASSLGPALIALNAKVKLVSAKGPREVPVASFFVAPTTATARETAIHPDELLTEIIVPAAAASRGAGGRGEPFGLKSRIVQGNFSAGRRRLVSAWN